MNVLDPVGAATQRRTEMKKNGMIDCGYPTVRSKQRPGDRNMPFTKRKIRDCGYPTVRSKQRPGDKELRYQKEKEKRISSGRAFDKDEWVRFMPESDPFRSK